MMKAVILVSLLLAAAQAAPQGRRLLGGFKPAVVPSEAKEPKETTVLIPFCTGEVKKECCTGAISLKEDDVLSPTECGTYTLVEPTLPLTWTDGEEFTCVCKASKKDQKAVEAWLEITPPDEVPKELLALAAGFGVGDK